MLEQHEGRVMKRCLRGLNSPDAWLTARSDLIHLVWLINHPGTSVFKMWLWPKRAAFVAETGAVIGFIRDKPPQGSAFFFFFF